MSDTPHLEAGKLWIGTVFARLCQAFCATLLIASWAWQDEDPEYRLCLQLTGQEALVYIPSRGLGFGRGQLVACGTPEPAHDAARDEVEATLRARLAALAATVPSPDPTTTSVNP